MKIDSSSENTITVEHMHFDSPHNHTTVHRHTYFEIMIFNKSSGKGISMIDFENYDIEENSMHIVYPGQVHLLEFSKDDNGILIQFTKEYLTNALPNPEKRWTLELQSNPMTLLSKKQANRIYKLLVEIQNIKKSESPFKSQMLQHYFAYSIFNILEILGSYSSNKKHNSNSIKFLQLAENQFQYNRVTSSYATQLNISIKKLREEVKEHLGKTPIQILHDYTALEIKRLLLVEALSNKEIAYQLNFDSTASYTRFVKKHFNCTPTELVKRNQSLLNSNC